PAPIPNRAERRVEERPVAPVADATESAVPGGFQAPAARPPAAPPTPARPTPFGEHPERLGVAPRPTTPPPRLRAWPEEASKVWTCEIEWKPGYRKSFFRAMATPPGGRRSRSLGESAGMKWGLMSDPEPPTRELVEAVRSLLTALEAAGWQRIEPAGPWYSQRFLWRGTGEPGPVEPGPRDALSA
ncbi:MAG TPA: hypothetical protein VFX80_07745, partial [Solirubrobacteraceae bacterium]|nr:hypothetical protein [Solirubrobacteraceae bacterium]